ncbi:contact-dependent growth inhibition system immunity protein [Yersinia alsatica]|uniref:contact-dependent growth inhibition system immunity protein n=1 Tax=Yersinia alsatica TaxID=2890317 RepID=UPI00119DC163|nr:contact-dependent growth inhibition system immunity protein [Yersinia alsatica]
MKYEQISYLLGAYFHQDWVFDAENPEDVISVFVAKEQPETVSLLKKELEAILDSEQELSEDFIYQHNGYYSPSADGLTVRLWFKQVLNKLSE